MYGQKKLVEGEIVKKGTGTVDGSEIRLYSQSRLVVEIPLFTGFYYVLFIPGGCLGFLPSTVFCKTNRWTLRLMVWKMNRISTMGIFMDYWCRCYLLCVYILCQIYTHFLRYIFTKVPSTWAN